MNIDRSTEALRRHYTRLATRLSQIGLILQGTITERTIVRPAPSTRRKKKTYGPYYQWTWKRQGRTVTVNLTPSQAKAYQEAIDNHRQLEKMVREMRRLSLRVLEATTPSVKKRRPRKRPT